MEDGAIYLLGSQLPFEGPQPLMEHNSTPHKKSKLNCKSYKVVATRVYRLQDLDLGDLVAEARKHYYQHHKVAVLMGEVACWLLGIRTIDGGRRFWNRWNRWRHLRYYRNVIICRDVTAFCVMVATVTGRLSFSMSVKMYARRVNLSPC
jgi:hypothetical protein